MNMASNYKEEIEIEIEIEIETPPCFNGLIIELKLLKWFPLSPNKGRPDQKWTQLPR